MSKFFDAPYSIIPILACLICLILLMKNRAAIGPRRATFAGWAFALLLISQIGTPYLVEYLSTMMGRKESFDRAVTMFKVLGFVGSLMYGVAFWLLFVAVSNRRKA